MIIEASTTLSMGHRLPTYDGICSSPHGHNIVVTAQVTSFGPFLDFKEVRHALQVILADFDHAMVLWDQDSIVSSFRAWSFRTVVLNVEPTTEAIAEYVFNQMASRGYNVFSIRVQETAKYAALCVAHPVRNIHRIL